MSSIAHATAGRSRADLIALIVRTHAKRLEQALAARIITAKQEHAALALLQTRAAREVDRI
jgi:hypothetical protein